MKKTHLALMAAFSTSLVSSVGAFCQTRGNTTPPSDADPNATPEEVPTIPRPHIISINPIPIPLPSIVAAVLNNPVMGTQFKYWTYLLYQFCVFHIYLCTGAQKWYIRN